MGLTGFNRARALLQSEAKKNDDLPRDSNKLSGDGVPSGDADGQKADDRKPGGADGISPDSVEKQSADHGKPPKKGDAVRQQRS